MTEDRDRQHHWLNEHEFQQTPGDSERQGSLACCSPWGHKESDTTQKVNNNNPQRNVLRSVSSVPPIRFGSAGKESACSAGDLGSIPGLGRSPGEGKGYPLLYSGLENSMDCIVHGVAKSQTQLSALHFTSPIIPRGRKRDAFLHRINHSGLYLLIHCPHKRPAVSVGQGPHLSTKWKLLSRVCQWFHAPSILHALSVILTNNPVRGTLLPWLSRWGPRGHRVEMSHLRSRLVDCRDGSYWSSPFPTAPPPPHSFQRPWGAAATSPIVGTGHVCRRSEWVSQQNKFENFSYLICIFQAEYISVAARKKTDCWLNSLLDFWTQWKQSLNNFVTCGLFLAQQKHFNWSLFLSQLFFLKIWGTKVHWASIMDTHTTVSTHSSQQPCK